MQSGNLIVNENEEFQVEMKIIDEISGKILSDLRFTVINYFIYYNAFNFLKYYLFLNRTKNGRSLLQCLIWNTINQMDH